MKGTVIVSTRNRAASLANCIEFLRGLRTAWPWELVLVDNGSTDATTAVCRDAAQRFPTEVRCIYEGKAGASAGRNAGLAVARGEYIAMTDDDVLVDPNWLDAIIGIFEREQDIGFIGGRVLLAKADLQPIGFLQERDRRSIEDPADCWVLMGANLAIRKAVLDRVGGFDERLGAGRRYSGCEDTELIYRMMAHGVVGCYAPEALAHHDHGRVLPEQAHKLMEAYGRGSAGFLAKAVWGGDLKAVKIIYWTTRHLIRRGFFDADVESAKRARARLAGFASVLLPAFVEVRG